MNKKTLLCILGVAGLAILPLVLWGAENPASVVLTTNSQLRPIVQKERPWALSEDPEPEQLLESVAKMSDEVATLEGGFHAFWDTADAAQQELLSLSREEVPETDMVLSDEERAELRDAVIENPSFADAEAAGRRSQIEGMLKSLSEGYPAETERIARLNRSLEAISSLKSRRLRSRKFRKELVFLEKNIRHSRAAADAVRVRLENIRAETANLGDRVSRRSLWLADRLREAAWKNEWQFDRLLDTISKLKS